MLSLAAPEVKQIQQMHRAAFFWRRFILSCYMGRRALTRVLRSPVRPFARYTPVLDSAKGAGARRTHVKSRSSKSAETRRGQPQVPCRQWVRGYFLQQPIRGVGHRK
jgi:hypothetical protein